LLAEELNHIQNEYVKAIDGYGGGIYTPLNLIHILGPTTFSNITGSNFLTGSLGVVSNGSVNFGNTSDGTLNIREHGTINVEASGTVIYQSGSIIHESGTFTQTGIRQLSGAGRTVSRFRVGQDSNGSYGPQNGDCFVIGNGDISQDRTYSLDHSKAMFGDKIRFVTYETTYTVYFTSTLTIFKPSEFASFVNIKDVSGRANMVELTYSPTSSGGYPAQGWYVTDMHVVA